MTASKRLSAGFGASVVLHAALLVGFLRPNAPVIESQPAPITVELAQPDEPRPPPSPPPAPAPPPPEPAAPKPAPRLPEKAPEPATPTEPLPPPEPELAAPPPAPTEDAPALDPARVNLATQVPGKARVVAFIRADRLRGTAYAAGLEAALAPTPDYRALVAGSGIALADAFDTVVISTPDPRDVTATFLAVKVRGDEATLRQKLAGSASRPRLTWESRPGGLVGVPQVHAPNDPRLVVSPEAGWLALARPEHVALLLAPAPASTPTSMPVDAATPTPTPTPTPMPTPTPAAPPAWVHALARLESSASVSAPDVIAIIGLADLGSRIDQLPGAPPAPTTGTLALALDKQLVDVSGTLTFASPSDAARFITSATDARAQALDGFMAKGLLRSVGALGIVESLVLTANGAEVVVTAHASPAELTELLNAAARWTQSFFNR